MSSRSVLRPTSATTSSNIINRGASASRGGSSTTSMLMANLNAKLEGKSGGCVSSTAAPRSSSRPFASSGDRPQSARTVSSTAAAASSVASNYSSGGGTAQPVRGGSASPTMNARSSSNNRGGAMPSASMSGLKREQERANALMRELEGGGIGSKPRSMLSGGPSSASIRGGLSSAGVRGTSNAPDAASSPPRPSTNTPANGAGCKPMAFMSGPSSSSYQQHATADTALTRHMHMSNRPENKSIIENNPTKMNTSSVSTTAQSGCTTPPPPMFIPSKPMMAKPSAAQPSSEGAEGSSSVYTRKHSVLSMSGSGLNMMDKVDSAAPSTLTSPQATVSTNLATASTAATAAVSASSRPLATMPTNTGINTAVASAAKTGGAKATNLEVKPHVEKRTNANGNSSSNAECLDSSAHLNIGLNGMERRHSGKYVHHYPCMEEKGAGGGHYVCGKCHVPLLSASKKITSLGGFATFSDYFSHSVDLEVVVPLLDSDTFEGSFVGLKCIKCRNFFGRMVDEKTASANATAMLDVMGDYDHSKRLVAEGIAAGETVGDSDDDDEDATDGFGARRRSSNNTKNGSNKIGSDKDIIQVNSCAILYTSKPPPPGYDDAEDLPIDPVASILNLRRKPNTNSTSAALNSASSPAAIVSPSVMQSKRRAQRLVRDMSGDTDASDESHSNSEDDDEEPAADDDLWTQLRGNRGAKTATA